MIDKYKNARVCFTGALLLALSAALPARADYQSTVLSQSPVGYWRLNETVQPQVVAGAANAGSLGASAAGVYNNYPTRSLPGPFAGGVAVGFDGVSQSVSLPWQAAVNPTAAFSVEMWANPGEVPKFAYLSSSVAFAANRSGWYLAQDDGSTFFHGNAFVIRMFNTNAANYSQELWAPISTTPAWYHLVLTYDGTTAALYTNGVLAMSGTPTANAAGLRYVGNESAAFTVGCRSTLNFFWPGSVAEVALYGTALSSTRVAAHYTTANTTPASYASTVGADAPLVYYRFQEPIDPPAANLGTLGTAAKGLYMYPAQAGVAGPSSPPYAGFEAANKAAAFSGAGGAVQIPALNLNTNTVTFTAWVKANGSQSLGAGLVVNGSGGTACGLTMDQVYAGLGLGYIWGGNTYGISPSSDLGLPPLPDNQWAFAALVIEPSKATIYTCDANNYANFASAVNTLNVNHQAQAFSSPTLIGQAAGATPINFNGAVDEVSIFKRSLSAGEIYTQYATAVGAVPPRLFTDIQGPADPVAAGDPLVLTVDVGGTADLTFIWRKDTVPIAVTSSGVYTKATSVLADQGTYDVTVTNAFGTVSSGQFVVQTVTPTTPVIVSLEGYYNRTLYPTGTLALAVSGTGGGLKYQWYRNATPISGATASSYRIERITNNSVAGNYSVAVTNSVGSATSGPPAEITVATVTAGSYEAAIVGSGPQAWWRLDEAPGSTNMVDAMGRHDGTYTNATGSGPLPTLGVTGALVANPNTAASFSSAGKGIGLVPYSPLLNASKFSAEVWVKTSGADTQVPLSNNDADGGWWWQTVSGNWNPFNPGGYAPINDYNPQSAIIPGQWAQLVLTYDSTRFIDGTAYPYQYFINGQGDGYVWGGDDVNGSGPLIVGARGLLATLADRFFDGQVDEVTVYSRLLSGAEITAHYAARGTVVIPPSFTVPLLSQNVATGKTITFTTTVQGTTPISLQWYKGAAPIGGQTTSALTLANVTTADIGTYTLWATNTAGTNSTSATLNVFTPTGYANVTNDLVLHLRFEGDTTDTSGRNNNGTPSTPTAPAYVAGIIGSQALQYTTTTNLSGAVDTASYVVLGAPADLLFGSATSFSIGTWVKLPAGLTTLGDLPFIGTATNSMNNPGWALGPTYGGGGWQFCINDGSFNLDVNGPANSINDGNFHHFLVVIDRTAKLANAYLDGVLVASRDITALGNVNNNNSPILIGQAYSVDNGNPVLYPEPGTSTLDDLGIWRRALTAADAANIAAAGLNGRSFDTVAPASVTITVSKSGSNVTFSWSQGTLLQADAPDAAPASWTPVPGASAPSYTFTPPATGSKYYKVQVQ